LKPNHNVIKVSLTAAFVVVAFSLKADVQGSLNVLAHALAAAKTPKLESIAVVDFSDRSSGLRTPFCPVLEDDLRQALTQAGQWKVLEAGADTQNASAVLTGSYLRDDDQIHVHAELHAVADGALLWSRNAILQASDVDASDFGAPAQEDADSDSIAAALEPQMSGDEGDAIPSYPERRSRHPWHFDVSVAYKAFFPTNTVFQTRVGSRLDALDLGMSFDDFVLLDFDFWNANTSVGTVDSLDYAGTDLALVYPLHLGNLFTVYLGPGGRFGSIEVNDSAINYGDVAFGNNGFDVVAGAKVKFASAGLDLRYSYDMLSTYTGYHTARLGAFYEFGR
jgi:hypothetical protein